MGNMKYLQFWITPFIWHWPTCERNPLETETMLRAGPFGLVVPDYKQSRIRIIRNVFDEMAENTFLHSPQIVRQDYFDLSGYEARESEIPGVSIEYVNQGGPGTGDGDFSRTKAWAIGGGWLLVCEDETQQEQTEG